MKVLLVVKSKVMENLGVMYLSSVIKKANHECNIVDLPAMVVAIQLWKPEILGLSIMTGDRLRFKNELFKLNDKDPLPKIVVGGPDPTFFPEGYDWADEIVPGEGELWAAGLTEGTRRAYTINDIPWPDRTAWPNEKIRDVIASRGCSYGKCGYCYNSAWEKMFPDIPKLRIRDARDVVNEIASLKSLKPLKAEFIYFQDATFGTSMKWLREFSQKYKEQVNIPYHAHLRPNQITEERVRLLHESSCVSVKIALETASDRLRVLINRGDTNNEDAYIAAKLLKENNIALILQNILGLPSSTIEDDLATLEVNIKCKPAYAWSSIFQPYPMTDLAIICEQEGYYTGDYSEIGDNFFDESVLNFPPKQKEQIACLQRIFAFCVEMQVMPQISDLTWERLPKFIHNIMRKVGDKRMFPNITLGD